MWEVVSADVAAQLQAEERVVAAAQLQAEVRAAEEKAEEQAIAALELTAAEAIEELIQNGRVITETEDPQGANARLTIMEATRMSVKTDKAASNTTASANEEAPHCWGTHMRQPTKCAAEAEAEAPMQCKQARRI